MISTRTEVKTLLSISVSTYDTLIDTLLPIVQADIIEYTKNHFDIPALKTDLTEYDGGEGVSFASATKTIADTDADLPFSAGQNIYVQGSRFNDGHYTVATGSAASLTVSESLTDEAAGASVTIRLVKFPDGLKTIFADMISFRLSGRTPGVTSESFSGGASFSYDNGGGDYPMSLRLALNKYRKVRFM